MPSRPSVVIPWRLVPGRERHLDAVRARLALALPDAEIVTSDSGHDPFSRAGSKNAGAAKAGGDVLVFCDADTLVDPPALRAAVAAAGDGRVHYPFTNYRSMTQAESRAVLAGRDPATTRGHGDVPNSVGGCVVMARSTFQQIGGYDEQFVGWGHEDVALALAGAAMAGTARHKGTVHHLWHPDSRGIGSHRWKRNAALLEQYQHAARTGRMPDLIGARSMAISSYLTGLADGNYHRGGIRALQVGVVDRIDEILADCEKLIASYPYSQVKVGHITGWTRPIGDVRQWSLWNTHGQTHNTSEDFALFKPGRSVPDGLTALAEFAAGLPSLGNLRLNMLGPGGALSPHEEHLPIPLDGGKVGLRARFHLPVITNPQATLDADGQRFHFELGKVYAFNNGCIHSARNASDAPRFHLVWDQLMTRAAHDAMFKTGTAWIRHDRAEVPVLEEFPASGYEKQPGMTADEFAKRRLVYIPA